MKPSIAMFAPSTVVTNNGQIGTPGIEGLVIKNNKEKIFSDQWKA